ncbi:undecaprenyl-diphosphate phosphatase [Candidatus Woesebacteria bacterium]|nr:undecaprenyl-diphosphate phosphatase [Candidatus Woesebacteria bacterium]
MDILWWEAAILGVVQGITEFLPVSSSGHLALFQHFFGLSGIPLTFDVMTHAGTFIAIIAYFWKDIRQASLRLWFHIALANIPVFIMGFAVRPYLDFMKDSRVGLATAFLITAFLLIVADSLLWQSKQKGSTWFHAIATKVKNLIHGQKLVEPQLLTLFVVGIYQAFAVLPGVSRSGSTLTGGAVAGYDRETAFKYAFLIGIPAVGGAVFLDFLSVTKDNAWGTIDLPATLLATAIAMAVGLVSLRLLRFVVHNARLKYFAFYCVFC